jgi:hypothetical protein
MALAVEAASSITSKMTAVSTLPSSIRTSRPMTANPNRTISANFVVDWNNPATLKSSSSLNKTKTDDENLQEAFRRFREQRMVCLK